MRTSTVHTARDLASKESRVGPVTVSGREAEGAAGNRTTHTCQVPMAKTGPALGCEWEGEGEGIWEGEGEEGNDGTEDL